MKIEINSQKDLDKFYRKLWLYKSLFYKKITFETNDKSIKPIVEALNIKKRKQRITYIYDKLCKQIDDFYKGNNICGFKNGKCYVQQKLKNNYINGCCRFCLNQSSKGCTTSNLTCKLFTCSEVEKRCKVIKIEQLKLLKLLNKRQNIIAKTNYFTKRETFINDLYISSFVIWEVRQLFRIIKIYIKIRLIKVSFK